MAHLVRARGLHTSNNELTEPEGALDIADNVVIDFDDILECRRGYKLYGDVLGDDTERVKQLMIYKDRIIRHYGSLLEFDDGSGSFTQFNGTYDELVSGLRIKYLESNGNLYFTTDEGIKKISALVDSDIAADSIEESGVPRGLDLEAELVFSDIGYLPSLSVVAYRVVWGKRDNNNNLILGFPSQRKVISNTTDGTYAKAANVKLNFPIPDGVDQDNFYQVYRSSYVTAASLATLDEAIPNDEMQLVYEENVTSSDMANDFIEYTDELSEDFKDSGAFLYTNEITGEGILQANSKPPLARDIAQFRNSVFYANTKTEHFTQLSVLSADGVSGYEVALGNEDIVRRYKFGGATQEQTISCTYPLSDSDYFVLYSAEDEIKYVVWYDTSGSAAAPNRTTTEDSILIKVDISGAGNATDVASTTASELAALSDFINTTNSGSDLNIVLSKAGSTTAASDGNTTGGTVGDATGFTFNSPSNVGYGEGGYYVDIASVDTSNPIQITTSSDHGLYDTQLIYLSGNSEVTAGYYEVTRVSSTEFTIPFDNSAGAGSATDGSVFSANVVASSLASVSQAIDETARSLIKVINSDNDSPTYAYYTSTNETLPGLIEIRNKTLEDKDFYLSVDNSAIANKFSPTLTVIASPTTSNITTSTTFSDNLESPNRIYFSKISQPEAVPLLNFIEVGPKDEPIERIVALRDNLFVFKEDAIYIVTGATAPNFGARLFDNSTFILAPDSAEVLNNQIYLLTSQGVSAVSETGVSVISRPIEREILNLTTNNYDYKYTTFGLTSESDRAYHLWMPTLTTDTVATQCYRYNTFTRSWTRWTKTNTCGVLNPGDDKIYLGAGDVAYLEQERKNKERQDYSDREYDLSFPNGFFRGSGTELSISSTAQAEVGDVVWQEQYITVANFNRLLRKLDSDPGLDDTDYFSSLRVSGGDNLAQALISLVSKIDSDDTTTPYTTPSGTNTKIALRDDFNDFVSELNLAASETFFKNYKQITVPVEYEVYIIAVNRNTNVVTVNIPVPFQQGAFTLFKAINTSTSWAPAHFGDPYALKQISEGTVMFDQDNFYKGTISYKSDISQHFEEIDRAAEGPGFWGQAHWGEQIWGGGASDAPMRTLIPRNKQRCRYLSCKFDHAIARENFRIVGVSFKPRVTGNKAYRR